MQGLSEYKSNLFHLIRWISALMVVFGHTLMVDKYVFGERTISPVYKYIATNHHAAVIFFFVLSGYLISFVSLKYSNNYGTVALKSYLLDRWSRIYSIVIPVLLLTIIFDLYGKVIFPDVYNNSSIIPQDSIGIRFFSNLFSLQGTWGKNMQFGSNPALWSIGYEFSFYLIFGIFILKGERFYKSRIFWICAVCFILIRGPLVACYFFIWLLGVAAHRFSLIFHIRIGWAVTLLVLFLIIILNHLLEREEIFSFKVVDDFLFAIPIALLFFFERESSFPESNKIKKLNLFMAHFSFTLYGTHLPLLFFMYSVLKYSSYGNKTGPEITSVLMVILCILFAYFFSKISESRRLYYRNFATKSWYFFKKYFVKDFYYLGR